MGQRSFEGSAHGSLADALTQQGRFNEARDALRLGERLLKEVGNPFELAKLMRIRGRMEARSGDIELAGALHAEAEAVAASIDAGPNSELVRESARLCAVLGRSEAGAG